MQTGGRRPGELVFLAIEVGGGALSLVGASLAVLAGKLLLAAVLALTAVGIALRFVRRRKPAATDVRALPPWMMVLCAVLSLIETAVLVEAVNLPVRMTQTGFERGNLLIVAVLIVALFVIQLRFLHAVVRSRASRPSA